RGSERAGRRSYGREPKRKRDRSWAVDTPTSLAAARAMASAGGTCKVVHPRLAALVQRVDARAPLRSIGPRCWGFPIDETSDQVIGGAGDDVAWFAWHVTQSDNLGAGQLS